MRSLLLINLLALGLAACQSSRPLYPTGIYKTAAAFQRQQPSISGTNAGRVLLARKLYVVNAPGSVARRTKISLDSVWGYAGSNHEAYRVYKRQAYQVEQADTLAVYSQIIHTGRTQHTAYFFSQGLTCQVQKLSKKRLKRTYAANTHFLELLRTVKWYQSLASYESPAGGPRSFRLVALYRESVGLPTKYPH